MVLRSGSCPTIIHVLEQEASELYDGQELFDHHRQRKGALNLVGNLANGLSGVLDSQYAQNMKDVIRRIQAKELYNTHLLKSQSSILDSTINVIRTSKDEMERRIRHMDTHVTDLENAIKTGNMAEVSSELTIIVGHIRRKQTAVISIASLNIISLPLISRKELINIQALLSKRRRLPVTQDSLHDIYQVMVSEVQELDNTLIYCGKIIINILVAWLALTRHFWPAVLPTVLVVSTTSRLVRLVLQSCSSLKMLARCSSLTRRLGDCS